MLSAHRRETRNECTEPEGGPDDAEKDAKTPGFGSNF
jgi:hypothetical protein